MAKKIFKIQNNLITFVGAKGEEVSGTNEDCRFVGGNYDGTNCLVNFKGHIPNLTNERTVLGQGNTINNNALNNNVLGNLHTIDNVDDTHTVGKFAHTIRHGEFNHAYTSSKGRSQRSVLMFEGRTTDDTETEIYLGGVDGKRFVVDESFEGVISFESRVVCKRIDGRSSAAMGKFQHATFRVTLGVLDRLGIVNKTNHNSGISGWTNDFTAVSATPDYIKATVTGQSGATIDWTVICYVNEIRTTLV